MVEQEKGTDERILNISFNQDQGCFVVSTGNGFRIYNSYPFKDAFKRDFKAGIGIATMLFRSNIIGLVGGGAHPQFPRNKVILWDDHQMKCIGELGFKSDVRAVRLRKECIVVALDQCTCIYQISDIKLMDAVDTYPNPQGICALNSKDSIVLIVPDKKRGYIRIINYGENLNICKKAHQSALNVVEVSQDGKICATASENGTVIRVFSTCDGSSLQEVRRGTDKADIQSIAFDKDCFWMACSSDKGTIHIFSLEQAHNAITKKDGKVTEEMKGNTKNKKSAFKFMKGIFSYFSSEWSFARFRIPDARSIVAFSSEDSNSIIGIDKTVRT